MIIVYRTATLVSVFIALLTEFASAQLSGNYVINSLQPTGGTNFQSFTDFAAAVWTSGVSGPVTVIVMPGSGPYTEQVTINTIPGASSQNAVTIDGNNEVLQYSSSQSFPNSYTLKIASGYVTINNLHVKALHPTYGAGIYVTNNATNVTLVNNTIEVTKSNSSSSAFGIVAAGATNWLLSGTLSDSLHIIGNQIIGGYSGIQLSGQSFTSGTQDPAQKLRYPVVINNVIKDFYAAGVYLSYTHDALVSNNQISRPTRTNSGSDSQTPAGVTITSGSIGFMVEKNRVFDFAAGGDSAFNALARGVYISGTGTALTSGTLRNNLFYGLDNNHSSYGMQINSWSGLPIYVYHNTIVFDQTSGTAVSPAFPSSGYQTAAFNLGGTSAQSNIHFLHNIVHLRRDGNIGKRIYYIGHANTTFTSNFNVYYYDGLGQGTTDFARRGGGSTGTTYATLADWQTATGYDQNSIIANPQFSDPVGGYFMPTNQDVRGEALGTSDIGVADDILGNVRDAQPDPGAYEMEPCGVLPNAQFTFTQDGPEFSFTASQGNATSYHWLFGDAGDTSNVANPTFFFSLPGVYTVTLVVTNPCGSDTTTQTITIVSADGISMISRCSIFPNPSHTLTTLYFDLAVAANVRVVMTDAVGRAVAIQNDGMFQAGSHRTVIETAHLACGLYNVVLNVNGMNTVVMKLAVAH